MKKTIVKLVFSAFMLTAAAAQAQQPKVFGYPAEANPENGLIRCATTQYEKYLEAKYPERQSREEFEAILQEKIQLRRAQRTNGTDADPVLTIPVVVHIIHNGDPVGVNENIADAQVFSQITVLNQDYRRQEGTPGFNTNAVGADVGIEFCLAQVDPDGNPTNGIDRVNMGQAEWEDENDIDNNLKPATQWDPNQYFNIWVVNFGNSSDLLGYAQYPNLSNVSGIPPFNGAASTDGVVIGAPYFGSQAIYPVGYYAPPYNRGRTATHEIGHCLGLFHIWGDNASCTVNATDSGKDYCPDTPAANDAHYSCSVNADSCPLDPGNDMVQNYMDYTNDACMNIFTQNQKERMVAVLQNASRRASLLTSTVCQSTAGREDFELLQGINIYPNPVQSTLTISAGNDLPDSYIIYNSLGQTMASVKTGSTADLSVNTASYSSGLYFIKIQKGSQSKTIKFIKN